MNEGVGLESTVDQDSLPFIAKSVFINGALESVGGANVFADNVIELIFVMRLNPVDHRVHFPSEPSPAAELNFQSMGTFRIA